MANPASFTRSAARATSSAYRRLPIRWRLAGGSAVLTLVILLGFAPIVGVLTQRRIYSRLRHAGGARRRTSCRARCGCATHARRRLQLRDASSTCPIRDLNLYAAPAGRGRPDRRPRAARRRDSRSAPSLGPPSIGRRRLRRLPGRDAPAARSAASSPATSTCSTRGGCRTSRRPSRACASSWARRARRLAAGPARRPRHRPPRHAPDRAADRRRPARSSAPATRRCTIPKPTRRRRGRRARRHARGHAALARRRPRRRPSRRSARQREFVADASHELRTPLTAVLANLELLEEELEGEQRDTAAAALRSTRRMRRLVADLLLLARADAGREAPHRPVDLSAVLVEAAAELEPVAGDHRLVVDVADGAVVDGARDELHRLALNLMDNALKHTEPGTEIRATVRPRRRRSSCSSSRTTVRASRPTSRRGSSSASSAAPPTAADRAASASRSCVRSPRRTAAPCASKPDLRVRRTLRRTAPRGRARGGAFDRDGHNLNLFEKLARCRSAPKRLF